MFPGPKRMYQGENGIGNAPCALLGARCRCRADITSCVLGRVKCFDGEETACDGYVCIWHAQLQPWAMITMMMMWFSMSRG